MQQRVQALHAMNLRPDGRGYRPAAPAGLGSWLCLQGVRQPTSSSFFPVVPWPGDRRRASAIARTLSRDPSEPRGARVRCACTCVRRRRRLGAYGRTCWAHRVWCSRSGLLEIRVSTSLHQTESYPQSSKLVLIIVPTHTNLHIVVYEYTVIIAAGIRRSKHNTGVHMYSCILLARTL